MRKLAIAAALLGAAFFSGNASAITGSYADGVKAPASDTVKVAYCYRGGCGCCYRRVYYRPCGCGCGGWGGGFFGIF